MKLFQPLTKDQTEKNYKISLYLVFLAILSNAVLFASLEVDKAETAFMTSQQVRVSK